MKDFYLLLITGVLLLGPHAYMNAQEPALIITEFMALNETVLADEDGDYSDWIELYNQSSGTLNVAGWGLTDEPGQSNIWYLPDMELAAGEYLVVFASGKDRAVAGSELHAGFKLSGGGEYLGLFQPDGSEATLFSPFFPSQSADVSYGLYNGEYVFFDEPTPGADNSSSTAVRIPPPDFSHERGLYSSPFDLILSTDIEDAFIRYTLDGSTPGVSNGFPYTGPIHISKTTVVRAMVMVLSLSEGESTTHTYIFPEDVIHQPNDPEGYPAEWGPYTAEDGTAIADYEMDPELMADPALAASIKQALSEIPTVCLTSDIGNFFSHSTDPDSGGIYIYTGAPITNTINGLGDGWERPVSFEFFEPDGSVSLQENCGVRLQGGHSRRPEKSPKHSFRLVFRSEYGEGKFRFPFFGEDSNQDINTITMRAGFCNTWVHSDPSQRDRYQGIRDGWAKDTQRDMGWNSGRYRNAHLYVNGIYWGIYQPTERMDKTFAAAYLDGGEDDFDVIKDYQEVVDGEINAWDRLVDLASNGFETDKKFYYVQGRDENGKPDLSIEPLVDVDNLIDYMLINFYGGNTDWDHHNWAAMRNRVDPVTGFQFFCWDSEHILESRSHNMLSENNSGCPSFIFQKLRENEEFKRIFADHVVKHCYNDGALTPEGVTNRWMIQNDILEDAIPAESARWGDYRRDVHPKGDELYLKDPHWLAAREYLLDSYFPNRTSVFISQLRQASLFPNANPPLFQLNGETAVDGLVQFGDELTMTVSTGNIYYTSNGTDPVIWDESSATISEDAILYDGTIDINQSGIYMARTLSSGQWSAMNSLTCLILEDYSDIKITEVHYHPLAEEAVDSKVYEFVEMKNTGNATIDVGASYFDGGIDFTFPDHARFGPGEFIVLAENRYKFFDRYGFAPYGEYSGQLDNGGEWITYLNPVGDTVCHFRYSDTNGWPAQADGAGYSLVPVDFNPVTDQTDPLDWRASVYIGGSPGMDDEDTTSQISVKDRIIPEQAILAQNYPNPFSDMTWITFELPESAYVELSVFNLTGQKVATLVSSSLPSGRHVIEWSGISDYDGPLNSGIYFYRLKTRTGNEEIVLTRKMVKVE